MHPSPWQHLKAPAVFLRALFRYIAGRITDQEFRAELNRARKMTGREPI